jgi:hypothetical protein
MNLRQEIRKKNAKALDRMLIIQLLLCYTTTTITAAYTQHIFLFFRSVTTTTTVEWNGTRRDHPRNFSTTATMRRGKFDTKKKGGGERRQTQQLANSTRK